MAVQNNNLCKGSHDFSETAVFYIKQPAAADTAELLVSYFYDSL